MKLESKYISNTYEKLQEIVDALFINVLVLTDISYCNDLNSINNLQSININ